MPRLVSQSRQFKKDLKKQALSGELMKKLKEAVAIIASGGNLPREMRDHELVGEYKGYRECHLAFDLLLIYVRTPDTLRLARIGSHSDLFGR